MFYYYDTIAGSPTVTSADSVFESAPTQVESVRPAVASKLEIASSPLTLIAGTSGPVTVDLVDQYGNTGATTHLAITSAPFHMVAGTNSPVTIQLEDAYNNMGAASTSDQTINLSTTSTDGAFYASSSGGSPITGVPISAGQVGSIQATSGALTAGTTSPITVTATSQDGPSLAAPMIESDQVVTTQKLNKGKKVGKPVFSGSRFQFNMPVTISSAKANVYSTTTKRVKKKTVTPEKAVSFTPSYDPSTNTVILTLRSTTPFAKSGGEIRISGVASQAGTPLSPSEAEFVITKNTVGITET